MENTSQQYMRDNGGTQYQNNKGHGINSSIIVNVIIAN